MNTVDKLKLSEIDNKEFNLLNQRVKEAILYFAILRNYYIIDDIHVSNNIE